MISSMQKNKKWLLPTIWISTIAFIGAGFVGWGSYSPTSTNNSVATVGSKDIPIKVLQEEYSNLYSQYKKAYGDKFNDELAKKLHLKESAYNRLVQKYLFLNFADEFGFVVSNEEIIKELVKIPTFQKDGKFDSVTYKKVLEQNRLKPSEFEENIKTTILLQKVLDVYKSNISDVELKNINPLLFASNKVQINILDAKDIKFDINKDDIKSFYDKNKENYKSSEKYEVNVATIDIKKDDEKKSKKEALKLYLDIKKGKSKFTKKEMLDASSQLLSTQEQDQIFNSKIGTILKPIQVGDKFGIYQLIKKIQPQIIALKDIEQQVKNDFKNNKIVNILNQKKEKLLKEFKGVDIGYISTDKLPTIKGLDKNEISQLVQKVSTTLQAIDYLKLDSKIIVFKLLDTKLATYDKLKDKQLNDPIVKLKDDEILSTLVQKLKSKYEVTSNFSLTK